MLIAESEDGQYEPVGVVASIGEAREIAASDLKGRMRRLDRDQDPGLLPLHLQGLGQRNRRRLPRRHRANCDQPIGPPPPRKTNAAKPPVWGRFLAPS